MDQAEPHHRVRVEDFGMWLPAFTCKRIYSLSLVRAVHSQKVEGGGLGWRSVERNRREAQRRAAEMGRGAPTAP